MQSVSSRIWTRVAVSISYDGNHYTTGTNILETVDSFKFFLLSTLMFFFVSLILLTMIFVVSELISIP